MEKVMVSEEYINEFTALKLYLKDIRSERIFNALNTIHENPERYSTLWSLLFDDYPQKMEENQLIFTRVWAGEIGFEEEEDQYIVWFKGSEVEGEWATFVFYGQDKGRVYSQYGSKKSVKGSKNCWLGEIEAFKLFNTGMFEIEKVEQ